MPVLSLDQICRDGRFVPIPGGAYFHPGTMAEPVDLLALTRAMAAARPGYGGAIVMPETAFDRPGALRSVRIALDEMPAGVVLTGPDGSAVTPDAWLGVTDETGAQAYLPYRPGMTFSPRVVPVDAAGRETPGPPAGVRILPRADADTRELLRTAARLAVDHTRPPIDRIRDLTPTTPAGYLLATGMILTGRPDAWDTARVAPPTLSEVRDTFAGGGTVPLPGSPALVHTSGLTGERLTWLVTDAHGTTHTVAADGVIAPVDEPFRARMRAAGTTVTRFGPEPTAGTAPAGDHRPLLEAALDRLAPWDGVPDCVDRVATVLAGLGGLAYARFAEGLRGQDALAARMGGWFGPAGGPGLLTGLLPGTVAPLWVQPRALPDGRTTPGREAHMVLVQSHDRIRFTLLETQADGTRRFQPFTLADRPLPEPLTGTLRLVQDADGLRQLDLDQRRTVSAPPGAVADRTLNALTDPATGRREPGALGAELEPMVRIGAPRVLYLKPRAPQWKQTFENLLLLNLPSVGLLLKGDMKVAALGRSGRWYGSEERAREAEGRVQRVEAWRIIEVVTHVGAALPGETHYLPASTFHVRAKVMIRWLQTMGRHGYPLYHALSLTNPAMLAYFERWIGGLDRRERDAAWEIRDALAEVEPEDIAEQARDEPLFSPSDMEPANLYHSTVDVSLAAVPTLFALRRDWVRGRDPAYDDMVRMDEAVAEQAGRTARTFVRQLVDGPLDENDVTELLRGTEAHELRGILQVVLTHLMVKAYATRLKNVGLEKNGVLALIRYHLDDVSEYLPPDLKDFLTRNFADLVRDLDQSLAKRLPGLAKRGERWTEKRMPLSSSTARGPRYKHVMRGALLGDPDRLVPIDEIVGALTRLEINAPFPGQPQRFAFELRLHVPARDAYDPARTMTSLDGTDEYLRHSLYVTQAAERAADQARAWTAANGSTREVAARLSAAHGTLTPWHNGIYSDPAGRLWEKRDGVWGHPAQLVSRVSTSGRLDGARPVLQRESGRHRGARRPVLALLSRKRWSQLRPGLRMERSSAYLVLARPIGHWSGCPCSATAG